MRDWEPAPPSARLKDIAARIGVMLPAIRNPSAQTVPMFPKIGDAIGGEIEVLRDLAADVAAMERRLAELTPKERADAE